MPRYNYKCSNCGIETIIVHLIDEQIDFCTSCQKSDTMIKLLTKPTYIKNNNSNNNRVGVLTKEYIEANKELLESEKLKAKSETYDPT